MKSKAWSSGRGRSQRALHFLLLVTAAACGRTRMFNTTGTDAGGDAAAARSDVGAREAPPFLEGTGGRDTGTSAGSSGIPAVGGRGAGGGGRTSGAGGSAGRDAGGVDAMPAGGAGGRGNGGSGAGAGGKGGAVASTGGTAGSGGFLWRQSQEAFCSNPAGDLQTLDVWSDQRGVFLLATDDGKGRPKIWSNPGTGWQVMFNWPGDTNVAFQDGGLKGFSNGPLIVYGGAPCGIQFVQGGTAECSGAESFIAGLSVASAERAYAASYDRVLQFDGDFWTQLGDPLPGVSWVQGVWADPSTIVAIAFPPYDNGVVFRLDPSGKAEKLAGLPAQIVPYAVWGFGASDVWVGGAQGELVHYDGTAWSQPGTIPYDGAGSRSVSGTSGIGKIKLWGQGGKLFGVAGNVFGQWDGSRFKVLEALSGGAYFEGLWGNSPSEVFLAVHLVQSASPSKKCGPLQVHWFDGNVVGPL
jgi:hypothetical protein